MVAAVRPAGKEEGVWALPKGWIEPGEPPAQTAVREVAEETGLEAVALEKLGDVRYVYTWRGERVFKVVSFFLLRSTRGRIGEIPQAHRHFVTERQPRVADAALRPLKWLGTRGYRVPRGVTK